MSDYTQGFRAGLNGEHTATGSEEFREGWADGWAVREKGDHQ